MRWIGLRAWIGSVLLVGFGAGMLVGRSGDGRLAVAVTFGFAVVALATAWLAASSVQSAIATARQLVQGSFSARMPVDGPAEIRQLASVLNDMGAASQKREDLLNNALEDAARQRDLFYSIINASNDGLLLYGKERQLLATNLRCGDLLGFTTQELLTRDPRTLQQSLEQRAEDPELYLDHLERHFLAPDQPHQDLLILREPRRRVLRRYSSPVISQGGVQGRVFTYTDVTVESEVDRMKSEFVSMASHELRTPLTSVHGALQLALSGSGADLAEEDRELLEISLANTERLVRLVNDLLDLSKIEAGRMPLVVRTLDVAALLDEASRAMQGLAATRGTTIVARGVSPGLKVSGDRDHLLRVITNLLSNSLKYSPPETSVFLSGRSVADGVELSVADDGPGIPADQVDRLFRPFSRVGAQERQTTGGTGLGLAISRALVEQHGGRIWVERLQPSGTRFAFVLPNRSAERHREPSQAVA